MSPATHTRRARSPDASKHPSRWRLSYDSRRTRKSEPRAAGRPPHVAFWRSLLVTATASAAAPPHRA
eukprot:3917122-Pyramimonas_sp.AAC.1